MNYHIYYNSFEYCFTDRDCYWPMQVFISANIWRFSMSYPVDHVTEQWCVQTPHNNAFEYQMFKLKQVDMAHNYRKYCHSYVHCSLKLFIYHLLLSYFLPFFFGMCSISTIHLFKSTCEVRHYLRTANKLSIYIIFSINYSSLISFKL